MSSVSSTTIGYALLFALPPGIGVFLATLRVTGGEGVVLAAIAGIVLAVGIVLVFLGLATVGSVDDDRSTSRP